VRRGQIDNNAAGDDGRQQASGDKRQDEALSES
jgi:hypothetical protein